MMWSCIQTLFQPRLRSNVDLKKSRKKKNNLIEKMCNIIANMCSWLQWVYVSPECCCMWSNLLSQSTFTCTSWPSSRGDTTKCKASGPCRTTLNTGTSPMRPWSSGCKKKTTKCTLFFLSCDAIYITVGVFIVKSNLHL